jgi:uncharacterized Tic20 family protein
MSDSVLYFVLSSSNQRYGPADAATVREWVAQGRVHAASLSWTEGEAAWRPLAERPEFADALAAPPSPPPPPAAPPAPLDENSERQMAVWMHLSGFFGWVFPVIGLVVPLVLWLHHRERSRFIDRHGWVMWNAWVSYLIYATAAGALVLLACLGLPLLAMIVIVSLVGTVTTAMAASRGEVQEYPLVIRFFHGD